MLLHPHAAPRLNKKLLAVSYSKLIMLRVAVWLWYTNSGCYQKNNNQQYWWSPMNNFGQQRLNGTANQSAAKGGWVLPHFQHIISGVLMFPCPILAVFNYLCGWLVGHLFVGWLVVGWSVGWSTTRVPRLWEFSLQKDKGSWALGVSLQKDKGCRALGVSLQKDKKPSSP